MNTVVRLARAEDKDAVLAFTQKTWDWGDYIQYVWDDWLSAANGELAVAEVDGAVAGITMTTILGPGEGWLQGLRVHPDYRRHGMARQLTAHQLDWLRQRGVTVARLAVHHHNIPSQTLVAQTGFRRLASFVSVEQTLKDVATTDAVCEAVPPAQADAAWRMIEGSPTLAAAAGLWGRGWAWQRLTRSIVAEQASQGHVLGVRESDRWAALAIVSRDDDGQLIGYADGAGPAVERLAHAVTQQAKTAGAAFISAMLPPVPHIVAAFRRAACPSSDPGAIYVYGLPL